MVQISIEYSSYYTWFQKRTRYYRFVFTVLSYNVFTERCSRYQASVNNRILWTLKRLDHSVIKEDQCVAQR